MSELKPCELCSGDYHTFYDGAWFKVNCQNKHCKLYLVAMTKEQWNTRTQSQWISEQLVPALNKCFKSKLGCDGVLMVRVDDYNELVDFINKAALTKIGE